MFLAVSSVECQCEERVEVEVWVRKIAIALYRQIRKLIAIVPSNIRLLCAIALTSVCRSRPFGFFVPKYQRPLEGAEELRFFKFCFDDNLITMFMYLAS